MDTPHFDRRGLLRGSLGAFALAGPLTGLMAGQARAATNEQGEQTELAASPYGPIAPVADLTTGLYLLQLPKGFTYRTLSWRGDLMSDGQRVPPAHDGMAVVQVTGGRTQDHVLVRNHEISTGTRQTVVGSAVGVYDDLGNHGGGCTMMRVRNGAIVEHRQVIAGTRQNCAGGRSLWNSWLTCEETNGNAALDRRKHGYVFDVSANPMETVAEPIIGMGRFAHEATASDPVTGYVYMTEDASPVSGFYRYKPTSTVRAYGALNQGGTLQAAKIVGVTRGNLLALAGAKPSDVARVGQVLDIEWVDIEQPDAPGRAISETGSDNPRPSPSVNVSGPFAEARSRGALRMARGEGLWWDGRGSVYVVDTAFGYSAAGNAGSGLGAVWAYTPSRVDPEKGTFTLIYASSTALVGNNPDNITVSPTGGVVYCEDGGQRDDMYGRGTRLMGLTPGGEVYILAKNNVTLSPAELAKMGRTGHPFHPAPNDYRNAEFAGATFDPSGRVLYLNQQTAGITFAVTGPWAAGNL